MGKTAARHTSDEFVSFLNEVVASCPVDQEIHIILDNLSAHKTRRVEDFLAEHPHVKLHFTPTYSSWLNQVEIWFAKIESEVPGWPIADSGLGESYESLANVELPFWSHAEGAAYARMRTGP